MKKIMLLVFVLNILLYSSFGQVIESPHLLKLETRDDYQKYEKELQGYINWLISTPIDTTQQLRKEVLYFVRQWIKGSPTVLVVLDIKILSPLLKGKHNPFGSELLMGYSYGMVKFMFDHPGITDLNKIQLAGIEWVLTLYNLNSSIIPSKQVSKYLKLKASGGLEEWVTKKIMKKSKKSFKKFYNI